MPQLFEVAPKPAPPQLVLIPRGGDVKGKGINLR